MEVRHTERCIAWYALRIGTAGLCFIANSSRGASCRRRPDRQLAGATKSCRRIFEFLDETNGWAVGDGARRTRELVDIFAARFGRPTRTYVVGASMGGLIAIKLAETDPDDFAGTLAICAVAGGTRRHFDYAAHVRTLFDFFYPYLTSWTSQDVRY